MEWLKERLNSAQILLALTNIGPLLGVLWGDWTAFEVIFLYWLENVIIGAFAVCRMVIRKEWLVALLSLPMAAFFCAHYGIFTFVHGIFVFDLLGGEHFAHLSHEDVVAMSLIVLSWPGVSAAAAAIAIAHGFAWLRDRFQGLIDSPQAEMFKPYKRIIVLHIALLFGAFVALKTDHAMGVLLLIIGLKTGFDLVLGGNAKQQRKQKLQKWLEQQAKQLKNSRSAYIQFEQRITYFDNYHELSQSKYFQKLRHEAIQQLGSDAVNELDKALAEQLRSD